MARYIPTLYEALRSGAGLYRDPKTGRFTRMQEPSQWDRLYSDAQPPMWTDFQVSQKDYDNVLNKGLLGRAQEYVDMSSNKMNNPYEEIYETHNWNSAWVVWSEYDDNNNIAHIGFKSGFVGLFQMDPETYTSFYNSSSKGKWLWGNGYGKNTHRYIN